MLRSLARTTTRLSLWLLYDEKEAVPTADNIPLIAQYELKLTHDHLIRICKFSDVVIRFIPVKMVIFTRQIAPSAKAA